MQNEDYKKYLIDADAFVIETLGYILHNSKSYYNGLKKISDKKTATANGFKGIPYFYETKGKIISQYKMSSGECMLISLIDFLNNVIVKNPKYSLQGTTQGNGLTGGVPPVRFSM